MLINHCPKKQIRAYWSMSIKINDKWVSSPNESVFTVWYKNPKTWNLFFFSAEIYKYKKNLFNGSYPTFFSCVVPDFA